MKAIPIALSLSFLFTLSAHSQDSPYYARLKTGQTLFSTSLRLRGSTGDDKYLSLDNGRKIPIAEVDRYSSPFGLFVTVPGSAGTDIYRVDREGPKISLFSRVVYDPNAGEYDPNNQTYNSGAYTRKAYFRKSGEVQMHTITYTSLMNALSDSPESQLEIRIAKTQVVSGVSLLLASVLVEGIGLIETGKMHASHFVTTTSTQYPYTTNTTFVRGTGTSPLVYVGAGGFVAGIVLTFTARHKLFRAIDIYNGTPTP